MSVARVERETLSSPEIIEEVVGVGALIVTPNDLFYSIRETRTNRKTGKVKDMISAPMETVEPGESLEEAMGRLFTEEVGLPANVSLLPRGKICRIQLTPRVWLHAYLFTTEQTFEIRPGTAADVADPAWRSISQVLDEMRERPRPGLREFIKSYRAWQKEGTGFWPHFYTFCQDQVSEEEFKILGV